MNATIPTTNTQAPQKGEARVFFIYSEENKKTADHDLPPIWNDTPLPLCPRCGEVLKFDHWERPEETYECDPVTGGCSYFHVIHPEDKKEKQT